MPALGCKCMNVILHISSLKPCSDDLGMSDAILTLDGIQHQLEFLVDERRPSSPPGWTDYACKVCHVTCYRKIQQRVQVFPSLTDYTNNLLEMQNSKDFVSGFNLVVPVTSVIGSASDESVGKEDLSELDKLAGSIRSDLRQASQDRIEEMIRIEKTKLDKSLKEIDMADARLRDCLRRYHRNAASAAVVPSEPQNIPTQHSVSPEHCRKVTFGAAPEEPPAPDRREKRRPSPQEAEDFFQFDYGREEDSIFDAFGHNPEPPVDYASSTEDSEEEDSSGCEADMADIVSRSVPVYGGIGLKQGGDAPRKRAGSVKVDDIAHSMKLISAQLDDGADDIPRPRVMQSRSYNPSSLYGR
eukprot:sb/3466114/